MTGASGAQVVLVGGHESGGGRDLERFAAQLDGARATAAGRGLHVTVDDALSRGERVVVVPMTFGLDPVMVADAAKTLRWLARSHPGQVALAAPFGRVDHLISWLRTAANRTSRLGAAPALLIVAPHSNAFDEAELHRVAYLVATHGAPIEVGVAIADSPSEVADAAARLRRIGAVHIVAVPSGFAERVPAAGVESGGPLMTDGAVARVIGTRVRDALTALDAGDDGIAAGLLADHDHGYAHSHAFEGGAHDHADGTLHTHTHAGLHAHAHSHGDAVMPHAHALLDHDH